MQKDYRVQIRIKNAWFLRKMEDAGFDSVAELSRSCGVSNNEIGTFVNLKKAAVDAHGAWRRSVQKVADVLKCLPEDLFPPQHVERALARNTAEVELAVADVANLIGGPMQPDQQLLTDEAGSIVRGAFSKLKAREERVVRGRYGFDGDIMTLEDLSKQLGITKERIRQIEHRALRKLRGVDGSRQRRELSGAREVLLG